jgi:hypothetical protein
MKEDDTMSPWSAWVLLSLLFSGYKVNK